MRMWCIDPELLCNKHLIGEHGEIHKFRKSFLKQYSISGRIAPVVQIEPLSMGTRHDELADEMLHRGFKHGSDYSLPSLEYLPWDEKSVKVDHNESIRELCIRCKDCKKRIIFFTNLNQKEKV